MNRSGFNPGALNEYLAESQDQLERLTLLLSPGAGLTVTTDGINSIYRELHTLKGNSQLFGCTQLASVAHTLESSIDCARKKGDGISHELTDEVFKGLGLLEKIVKTLQKDFNEGDFSADITRLVSSLTDIISRTMNGASISIGHDSILTSQPKHVENILANEPTASPAVTPKPAPVPIAAAFPTPAPALTPTPAVAPVLHAVEKVEAPPKSVEGQTGDAEKKSAAAHAEANSETLRVQVNLLDNLMNLVGELVLVRNQVIQRSNSHSEDAEFVNLSQRLDVITTELQNEIMKTRMQPIGTILTKFHRLIRDMARDLNKDINLKLEGTETELDKTLIEAVKDPLTHIIRNSIDHGIESREERASKNKTKSGTIQIRAFHEGGQIVIEIIDDGRGLQRQKIGNKAIERGLITAEQFKKMSDREVCNLIFLPGFSTAEKVSNISGRGVGMDVVRTNIEKIGGVVDITSVEGNGSTMRLKIPLTLAIVPALLVKTDGQCFAIPQVKLTELVRLQRGDGHGENRIEYLQGQAVFRLRGRLLPLLSLEDLLGLKT
ncbi:MAG: chemotaxis protein CheA, partial [Proteobacteria bacterium]